ncbi:MAG: acyloxyacyl hydrolase [Flavobacteriales bacterium]|nr:acyloxyacyl hydrolase [Flavobacteriales bacterium]
MKLFISFLIFLVPMSVYSQFDKELWLEGRGKAGFLAAHSSLMGHLAKEHAFGAELSVVYQTKGKKKWHKAYKYPTIGITTFFSTVGNSKVLGSYYGLFPFINLPLIKKEKFSLSTKLAAGLGYTDKVYDPIDNKSNVAISTKWNSRITIGLDARITHRNHYFSVGIDASHFSNAAIKVPNLGLNMPFMSLAYGHRIRQVKSDVEAESKKEKYWEYGALAIASVKETFPTGGRKYPVYGLNFYGRRFFNSNTAMEVSLDFISKQAILDYHKEIPKTQYEILQIGTFVGFILPFDHLHLITGMGIYLKDKYQPEDFLYHRVGMRYVFENGININLVLKSHWARADYTEFGIGYSFKK